MAERVVEVVDDKAALAVLAARDTPDPWRVAEELCFRGEHDAAKAFALASPRPTIEKLADYVEAERKREDDASIRKTLTAMHAAVRRRPRDYAGALSASDGIIDMPSVTHVRVGWMRAQIHERIGDQDAAVQSFAKSAEAADRIGWIWAAARLHYLSGERYHRRGSALKALPHSERALALFSRLKDRYRAAATELTIGMLHTALGNRQEALEHLTTGLAEAEAIKNKPLIADGLGNFGDFHRTMVEYVKALSYYQRALTLYEAHEQESLAAEMLRRIGQVYLRFGEYGKALAHHERAWAVVRRTKDVAGLAESLRYLGALHMHLGEYAKALNFQEEALKLARRTKNDLRVGESLRVLGITYMRLGDQERAGSLFEHALKRYDAVGNPAGVVDARFNLAAVAIELKDPDEALEHLEKAWTARNQSDKRVAARILVSMCAASILQKDFEAAKKHAEQALALYEGIEHRAGIAEVHTQQGIVHIGLGDRKQGERLLKRAVRESRHLRERGLYVWCLHRLAKAYLEGGEPARALTRAREAVREIEELVGGLGEEKSATARKDHHELFEIGILAAARDDDVAEAVSFIERGRAGTLLESLNGRQSLRWTKGVPEALREEEAQAHAALRKAREEHLKAIDSQQRKAIRAAGKVLDAAKERVRDVADRIQSAAKQRAVALFYPRDVPLEDVQKRLSEGEALVLYGLAMKEALAVVLTPDSEEIVMLGPAAKVREACEALDASDKDVDAKPALDALTKLLVKPLALDKKVTRVLVSPTGPLSYLPFAALFSQEVVFTPSGTTHVTLAREIQEPGQKVLALGDPDYSGREEGAQTIYVRGRRLLPLDQTRTEAEGIGDTVLLGAQANETAFREALAKETRWRAVHLACHGLVDPELPTLSSLALSKTGTNDGFLTAIEVLNMEIPADLAVLSACETGKGRIVKGEGIVGLTRAFMFAGAPRVICSLWKVDDHATQVLMTEFYRRWNPKDGKPGESPATALRKAQDHVRAYEKDGKRPWAHPYFWAAWVLWGLPE